MILSLTPRFAIMLVFAGFCASVGAWAGAMPQVTQAAGISDYVLGLTLTGAALATMLCMSLGGLLGRYLSNRRMIIMTLLCASAVTFFLMTATSSAVFIISAVAFGGVLGLLDLFMNAEASAIEHDLRRAVFTGFHAVASVSLAVYALLSSYVSYHWGLLYTVALVVALQMAALLAVVYAVPPRLQPKVPEPHRAGLTKRWPLVLLGAAVGLTIATESVAIYWSAQLLEQQAPALAAITGIGVAYFGLCNALVRFQGDKLRLHFGDYPLLMVSIGIAMIGLLALGLSTRFAMSVAAFAVTGFGLAVLCPVLYSMAAAHMPHNRSAALSFMSLIAGPPRILAPFLFGWLASVFSVSYAFGSGAAVMGLAFGLVLLMQRYDMRHGAQD